MRDQTVLPNRSQFSVVTIASYRTSFETWRQAGILKREQHYLRLLSEQLGSSVLLTYDADDQSSETESELVAVAGRNRLVPAFLYSVLAPVLHWRLLRRASVVRSYQLRGAWTAALAGWIHRKPFVLRTGYVWSQFKKADGGSKLGYRIVFLLERFALRRADIVITASEADRDLLINLHRIPAERIHVIPNPVDTDPFRPIEGIEEQSGLVTYVGRLEAQKRIDLLIEVMRELPGARLRIIGNGSLRDSLERQAEGLSVEFVDTVPNENLPALLAETAVFVLPSRFEGTPKALLEAMACGRAVVIPHSPGSEEIVQEGITGFVVDSEPATVAKVVRRLLDDAALRKRLGSAARESVREKHSMSVAAVRETALIRTIGPVLASSDEPGSNQELGGDQQQGLDRAA